MTYPTHTFESDLPVALSPEGEARREAMLGSLRGQVRARGRRRRALQAAGVATPLLALGALMGVLSLGQPTLSTEVTAGASGPSGPIATEPNVLPEFTRIAFAPVTTLADITDRSLSDDELLELLHEAGHDAGLIRREGEFILTGTTFDAVDAPERDATPPAGAGAETAAPGAASIGA